MVEDGLEANFETSLGVGEGVNSVGECFGRLVDLVGVESFEAQLVKESFDFDLDGVFFLAKLFLSSSESESV